MKANIINAVSLIFLCHAIYSAHEHSTLHASKLSSVSSGSGTIFPSLALPLDIVLEALVALLTLIVGILLQSAPLRPIKWREWARNLQMEETRQNRENAKPDGKGLLVGKADLKKMNAAMAGMATSFSDVESNRTGFIDIRGARKSFQRWQKNQS